MSGTVKRFVLSFVNAAEDIPRLIRAYGKCCDGECALALRPHEDQGLLVHHDKNGGARFWSEKLSAAPEKPTESISPKESVAMVKVYQKALPKAGPITLRGNWRGYLFCEDGVPRVELQRKLATYGTLIIESVAGKGWKYRVVRAEKWFSRSGNQDGMANTLSSAIEKGLASAMGLLGEACSVRDSRRRAAFDAPYAETHPIKPAREGKDPTERFNPKEPKPAKQPKEAKQTAGKGRKAASTVQSAAASPSPATPAPAVSRSTASPSRSVPAGSYEGYTYAPEGLDEPSTVMVERGVGGQANLRRVRMPADRQEAQKWAYLEGGDFSLYDLSQRDYLMKPKVTVDVVESGTRRRAAGRKSAPAEAAPTLPAGSPEVDPEKDKQLLDAFSKAVAAALGGGAAA